MACPRADARLDAGHGPVAVGCRSRQFVCRAGLRHVLCTDVARDGALGAQSLALYTEAAPLSAGKWQASGGVRDAPTCMRCAAIGVSAAAISGKALLEERIDALRTRRRSGMLARRIIPCLDVRDGQVVKGVRFRDHASSATSSNWRARYRDEGADELVFYDITASPEGRSVDRGWVDARRRVLDIPFCVAGGIRSVADAEAC
jgi:phosphoribosylformimino-5-aminoimidazole carboxamide ribonucleotide (ProFAR) isomerase